MEKKILINLSFSVWPILNYELDLIQQKLNEGHIVKVLYCNASPDYCEANQVKILNYKKLKSVCNYCQSRFNDGLNWLDNKDKLLIENFDLIDTSQQKIIFEYDKLLTKKDKVDEEILLFLENISSNLLEVCITNIITTTESVLIDYRDKKNFNLFKRISKFTIASFYSSLNHMQKFNPDEVYIYNGRIYKYQPMVRIAQSMMGGENINVYEWPMHGNLNMVVFKNNYGHDPKNYSKQLLKFSNENDTNFLEKEVFTKEWLDKTINKKAHPWKNKQIKNLLPSNFNKSHFNITYFASSEFEFLGIPEVEKDFKFKNNYAAIKSILRCIEGKPNTFLNVRMHPLGGMDSKIYLGELIKLKEKHSNIEIIDPDSTADSYTLMKNSDLIIVIHSTAGLEAAYLKKNVIALGPTTYMSFEIAKNCSNEKELALLLNKCVDQKNFEDFPTDSIKYENIINYGYAFCNYNYKSKFLIEKVSKIKPIFKNFRVNMLKNNKIYNLRAKPIFRYIYFTYYIISTCLQKIKFFFIK
tara:strand:+ start:1561 stop:3138 length:1578 start_codon:yes stop_codon:yes gene_type:complete